MRILKLILALAIPIGLGAIAGMFTAEAVPEWFATLNSPSFSPPNWLFGPVWTTLYLLMGVSMFLIWKEEPTRKRNLALLVYVVQLLLNFGWSFIFFYYHRLGLALAEIVVLWISIVLMLVMFYKIKPLAAYLNIPYLLWVSFATILTASYYILN